MARFDVGSFKSTSGSITSTHSLHVTPKVALFAAATSALDTTHRSVASIGVLPSTFSIAPQTSGGVGFSNRFSGGSGDAASFKNTQVLVYDESFGSPFAYGLPSSVNVTTAEFLFSASTASTMVTDGGPPVAWALLGGDDALATIRDSSVTSVAGTTQASTGYGFQPNAALVFGQYAGGAGTSSLGFSLGFACVDTAGTRTQWSIDQMGRTASQHVAHKSASTVSAMKLHTSASTVFDVSVTSFRSDGLELTVNASSTTFTGNISVVGLSVPKVAAGKATITTNGAGAGQTGVTVTGLGQQVGFVLLASIGTSLQTLQDGNKWSFGFASSNGNQRSVSGKVLSTEESGSGASDSARVASYFNSTRAVTFTSAVAVESVGLFAVTTDGFTVTMSNTNANGWDLYWAAFSNTVQDMEAHILSSGTLAANLAEVTRMSAQILSSGTVQANLEREFETTRGLVAANAKIETQVRYEESGQALESEALYNVVENTTSPDVAKDMDLTTAPQRIGAASYQNAKNVTIIPPSTNTHPFIVSGSQTGGVRVSSRGANSIAVPEDHGADLWLYTTSTSGIPGVRVLIR